MPGPGADDPDDGFLGRWSRRKRAAAEQAGPPAVPPAAPLVEPEAAPPPKPEAEVEPPSLELIDKDFDLAHWLKQNVPESWRRAALRRAWESDPAISGYLDPARDYALDWNTPGGAPGYGPLNASDNVEEMIANIFGKAPEKPAESAASVPEAVRDDAAEARLSSNEDEAAALGAPQQEVELLGASQQEAAALAAPPQAVRRSEPPETAKATKNAAQPPPLPVEGIAALQDQPWPQAPGGRLRRRGGGATPL